MKTAKIRIATGATLLWSCICLAQDVVVTLVPQSSVSARPGQGPPDIRHGLQSAVGTAIGNEDIASCEVYGHQSSANGRASVVPSASRATNSVSYTIQANAAAKGGHYRTGTCIADRRIGFTGHDTQSSVSAEATATVRIQFPRGRPDVPYFVKISGTQAGTTRRDVLVGPDGKEIPLAPSDSPYPIIMSKPGQEYFLRSTATATAQAVGGTEDAMNVSGNLRVAVEPAPLLFGGRQTGFIRGGRQTPGHANVAVILLEGLPHCTATLIAPRTLLTAAHCVEGHMSEDRMKDGKISVAFGSVYTQPLFPPIPVTKALYPNEAPLVFNRDTLKHDVAVLYVKNPVTHAAIMPAKLHMGSPTWAMIKASKRVLIFVGYGFNVINNEMVGEGIKREASWGISGYDDLAISFSVPGTNTCMGDSGGPGFLEEGQDLLLAAITSGGNETCTSGFDTRVDAYLGWLTARIQQ